MSRPKKKLPEYSASVKVLGRVYNSVGDTAFQAIANLEPGKVKGYSILSLTKDKTTKEKILSAPQTFRLFNGGRVMREVALKNVSILFAGI